MKFQFIAITFLLLAIVPSNIANAERPKNFEDENLIAWCIVPFDSQDRTPSERAKMVKRLGLKRVAYDWREKHVPFFEEEILQYKKHQIDYFAFWGENETAFELFEKHGIKPQIWKMLASKESAANQQQRIELAIDELMPLVKRTKMLGCRLGIYNHGGWGGEPKNLVQICAKLHQQFDASHVGIVYNLHHGHSHLDDFEHSLELMMPFLFCVNLNGMNVAGDKNGQKILPLGAGKLDVKLVSKIAKSGYAGPIGIIGHTQDDVEERLRDNLDGLHWILDQIEGVESVKPAYRTHP